MTIRAASAALNPCPRMWRMSIYVATPIVTVKNRLIAATVGAALKPAIWDKVMISRDTPGQSR
jgi:hypothetical protein